MGRAAQEILQAAHNFKVYTERSFSSKLLPSTGAHPGQVVGLPSWSLRSLDNSLPLALVASCCCVVLAIVYVHSFYHLANLMLPCHRRACSKLAPAGNVPAELLVHAGLASCVYASDRWESLLRSRPEMDSDEHAAKSAGSWYLGCRSLVSCEAALYQHVGPGETLEKFWRVKLIVAEPA